MSANDTSAPRDAAEAAILRAVREVRFGAVEVTVHDGRVVQIERKEKLRFANRSTPDRTAGGPETTNTTGATGPPEHGTGDEVTPCCADTGRSRLPRPPS